MNRPIAEFWLTVVLLSAACAGNTPARDGMEICSSVAQPDVSAATAQRLEHASNLLEYENAWRVAHPKVASGTVSGNAVRALIRSNAEQIRGCYESAIARLRPGGGRVVVRFVIGSDGRVPAVNITSSDPGAPEVGCCVAKRVSRWTFPSPTHGGFVVVEYPFVVQTSKSR